jgi:hypothetical protein
MILEINSSLMQWITLRKQRFRISMRGGSFAIFSINITKNDTTLQILALAQ